MFNRLKVKLSFFRKEDENCPHPKYERWKPRARTIKIIAQMFIGALLAIILVSKFWLHIIEFNYPAWLSYVEYIHSLRTLHIVSLALAYSAGIELAYMLFTPGPDEAINPLISGVASALLYSITKSNNLDIKNGISLILLVIVLAALFMIKEFFIEDEEDKEKKKGRRIDKFRGRANHSIQSTE